MKKISAFFIFVLFLVGILAFLSVICAGVAFAIETALLPSYTFMQMWGIVCACYFVFIVFALTFWLLGTFVFNQIITINKRHITEATFKELYKLMNKKEPTK